MPAEVGDLIAESMQESCNQAVQPIQIMTNLNPLLGKASGGSRTICKTPMLYRMTLRARTEVADWDHLILESLTNQAKGNLHY